MQQAGWILELQSCQIGESPYNKSLKILEIQHNDKSVQVKEWTITWINRKIYSSTNRSIKMIQDVSIHRNEYMNDNNSYKNRTAFPLSNTPITNEALVNNTPAYDTNFLINILSQNRIHDWLQKWRKITCMRDGLCRFLLRRIVIRYWKTCQQAANNQFAVVLDMACLTASAYVLCWYVSVDSSKSHREVFGFQPDHHTI